MSLTNYMGMADPTLNQFEPIGDTSQGGVGAYFGGGATTSQTPTWTQRTSEGANNLTTAWSDMSTMGKLQTGLGIGAGLWGAWNSYNQGKLAKRNFNFQKAMMQKEHANTVNSYNARMEDRQRARVARDPNAHRSVAEYMSQYGAK